MYRSSERTFTAVLLVALALGVLAGGAGAAPQSSGEGHRDAVPSVEQAQALQQAGQWGEAATAWGRISRQDPDNGTAWFNLGYCLHAAGRMQEAIQVHQQAAGFDEYRGIASYNLGCAYALVGQPDAAIDALATAQAAGFTLRGRVESDEDLASVRDDPRLAALLEREPTGWQARLQQMAAGAQQFIEQQAPQIEQQVAALLEQAAMRARAMLGQLQEKLASNPRLAGIAMMLQQLLGDEHDQQQSAQAPPAAPAAPTEALAPDAAIEAARRHLEAGEFDQAIATFGALIEHDPDSADAWFGLAYALHMRGDYEQAIQLHQKAATYEPFKGISLYNLACAYALTGKTDEAIEALRAARDAGFAIADAMASDSDLDAIRDDPRFRELLAASKRGPVR